MADAKVRVRLDTAQARQDLRALYGEMGRPPSIPAQTSGTTGGAGAPPTGGAPGGSTVGGGGLNLTSVLSKLTAVLAAGSIVGTAGPAALISGGKDTLRDAIFSGRLGAARGALGAREDTASRFGRAFKQGAVSEDFLRQFFNFSREYGAGAEAQGRAQVRAVLGPAVIGAVGSEAADLAADAIPILGEVVDGLKALRDALK